MDSIRVSEAPDTGSIPVEATKREIKVFDLNTFFIKTRSNRAFRKMSGLTGYRRDFSIDKDPLSPTFALCEAT